MYYILTNHSIKTDIEYYNFFEIMHNNEKKTCLPL